ncbi:hypothetical protein AAFF_G00262450 [Aldrovandia affinis]|uniref:Uncharacterized protein n=1 Tax=Aldrovandia affinis TaxID=143900 RepID=A0AAD7SSG9_9TELE|nr:hypothetical protein AAFF_G00262450 [Aldrovandia affinis]
MERDEEDESHATECTLRRDSSDAEAEEEELFLSTESPGNTEALLLLGGAQDEGERCQPGLDEGLPTGVSRYAMSSMQKSFSGQPGPGHRRHQPGRSTEDHEGWGRSSRFWREPVESRASRPTGPFLS